MPQMRITSEAHEAAMAAPMGAMTLIERFSLLIMRGTRQEEEAYKAYVLGVIDMKAALEKVGVDKDLAAKVANAVIAGYK
jgi:hypothetical protein